MRMLLGLVAAVAAAAAPISVRVEPSTFHLTRAGARQQFLLLGINADGTTVDLTGEAVWSLTNPAAGTIAAGRLTAVQTGATEVRAELGKQQAKASGRIEATGRSGEFRFRDSIGSILTRRGCNSSNCHGGVKGRGGFKLSAASLYPKDDYEWIVKGGVYQVLSAEPKGERVPRIDLKAPENSLLLKKATGAVAHGGGKRFETGSEDHRRILEWIRQGAPFGPEEDAASQVARLEVYPRNLTLEKGQSHRVVVTAVMANGAREDLTHEALYLSNDSEVAKTGESGIVSAAERPGETAILIRAAGHAAAVIVGVVGEQQVAATMPPANNFIDGFVFEKLRRLRMEPSPLSSDAEFLRRVSLDLTGTLPPASRVTEFVASRDAGKRTAVIDALIASPEFTDYWTFRFQDLFRVAVFSNGINPKWSQMYGEWVRESIARNKPYDRIAWERLTAQGYDGPTRHFLPYDVIGTPAETMAEEVRVFFGRRLECAQCHNHPYESWSQDQFWGLAAFFSRMFKMGDTGAEYVIFDHPAAEAMGNGDVNGSIKLMHPRSKLEVRPAFLDGRVAPPEDRVNPRRALADWMIRHPYFAEAAVNRVWAEFFGRGLVDPVDDFRSTNPPSHPELLERLASEFRQSHDLRQLMRIIVSSRTYQLSSSTTPSNKADRTNYSHALPRPLLAEVLLDAVGQVTGVPESFTTTVVAGGKVTNRSPAGMRAIHLREPDLFYSRFLELYGRPNRLTLPERSSKANLGQALHMLAGSAYNERVDAPGSRLARWFDNRASDADMLRELYLTAFGREPDADESRELTAGLAARQDRRAAWKDLLWAVLSSREFAENH